MSYPLHDIADAFKGNIIFAWLQIARKQPLERHHARLPRRALRLAALQYRRGALMPDYTEEHARAGISAKLPQLETWPNQFPGYIITTRFPEYSSVCPKTGLPDYGTITIQYMPKKDCLELKALKMYLLAYRSLGIFYENAVNKILHDIVEAVRPEWCLVRGEFTPRGGLTTSVFARWPAIDTEYRKNKESRGQKGRARLVRKK